MSTRPPPWWQYSAHLTERRVGLTPSPPPIQLALSGPRNLMMFPRPYFSQAGFGRSRDDLPLMYGFLYSDFSVSPLIPGTRRAAAGMSSPCSSFFFFLPAQRCFPLRWRPDSVHLTRWDPLLFPCSLFFRMLQRLSPRSFSRPSPPDWFPFPLFSGSFSCCSIQPPVEAVVVLLDSSPWFCLRPFSPRG